jgi:hypothetical protein
MNAEAIEIILNMVMIIGLLLVWHEIRKNR